MACNGCILVRNSNPFFPIPLSGEHPLTVAGRRRNVSNAKQDILAHRRWCHRLPAWMVPRTRYGVPLCQYGIRNRRARWWSREHELADCTTIPDSRTQQEPLSGHHVFAPSSAAGWCTGEGWRQRDDTGRRVGCSRRFPLLGKLQPGARRLQRSLNMVANVVSSALISPSSRTTIPALQRSTQPTASTATISASQTSTQWSSAHPARATPLATPRLASGTSEGTAGGVSPNSSAGSLSCSAACGCSYDKRRRRISCFAARWHHLHHITSRVGRQAVVRWAGDTVLCIFWAFWVWRLETETGWYINQARRHDLFLGLSSCSLLMFPCR
jgi:hypothetical protein